MFVRDHGHVKHLIAAWNGANGSETKFDPICGVTDPETVVRGDELYCRHCIAREGVG